MRQSLSPDTGATGASQTRVAIMQPTYLPWCGYFDLIDQADTFILDDRAQFVAKSWHSRNRIRARDGNTVWLTVPVHRHRAPLDEILIDNSQAWQAKHWRTIKAAYSKTPGWPHLTGLLDMAYSDCDWPRLIDLTETLIRALAITLNIHTPIVTASSLGPLRASMAERIVDMVRAVNGDTLLNTSGAQPFLNQTMLEDIRLQWHTHHPTPYQQGTQEWQPYLSVIDLIAHSGSQSATVIRANYHPNRATHAQTQRENKHQTSQPHTGG